MKEINFRIIGLQTHQILLMKDWDDEDAPTPLISIIFFTNDIKIKQKLKYANEEKRDKFFNDFTDEQAQVFLNNILTAFNMNK